MDSVSHFAFYLASKHNFTTIRNYPDNALLFRKGKILYCEQKRNPELVRSYKLEYKQKEFTYIFSLDSKLKVEKSGITQFGIGRVLVFYYNIDSDKFITYFTELDSSNKLRYGNFQYKASDSLEVEKLLEGVLSTR